jgi:hypothetical protein
VLPESLIDGLKNDGSARSFMPVEVSVTQGIAARLAWPHAIDQVLASIEQRPSHRIVSPDREVWRDAGILAGLLAKLQQYGKAEQRKTLNNALIFLSTKAGLTVLTRDRDSGSSEETRCSSVVLC